MSERILERREFAKLAASLLVTAVLPIAAGCRNPGPSCSDEDLLTTPQRMLRASHEYTESSPHGPAKSCVICEFYLPEAAGEACGGCQILVGGPVNPAGHCDAWAAKT